MDRKRAGVLLTVTANLGVLGGLVFVGFELRQNTQQLRSEASSAITDAVNQMNESVYGDPELADILIRGEADFDSLDPVERRRFSTFQFSRLNIAIYVEDLAEEGVADISWDYIGVLADQFSTQPGLRQFLTSIEDVWVGSPDLYNRLAGR